MVKNITDYLDLSAEKYPNKVAFCDEKGKYTYEELMDKSKKVASSIIVKEVKNEPILIIIDKGVECIAAMMGVAYSGNFYSVLDVKMPADRICKIIKTLEPKLIILENENLRNLICSIYEGSIILYDESINVSINEKRLAQVKKSMLDTDLAYVLFTSGSTGEPKGVAVQHRSIISYIDWVVNEFDITEHEILANQTPFYFSMAVLDIFVTLKTGATLYIMSKKLFSFPINVLKFLNENKISFIYWVPSALIHIANLKALEKVDLRYLKKVLFAGEVMPNKQLNIWRKFLPGVVYANLYGPTEVTDICTFYRVNREFEDKDSLPIGISCQNCEAFILDNQNNLVKNIDEIGELFVRGSILAVGYYNDLDKTREVFVQNPLNNAYNEVIYKTGDLVKYNELGEILYLGRKDSQIKHMGYRIELGEIENNLLLDKRMKRVCVLYDEIKRQIVAFCQTEDDFNQELLVDKLKNSIPQYMMPNRYIYLEEFPINSNGKIDRTKLKQLLVK